MNSGDKVSREESIDDYKGLSIFGKGKSSKLITSRSQASMDECKNTLSISYSYKYDDIADEVNDYLFNSKSEWSEDEIRKNLSWFNDNYY